VQKYVITVTEWHVCHDACGCVLVRLVQARPPPPDIGINNPDAIPCIERPNHETGGSYRLPSVAELPKAAFVMNPTRSFHIHG